MGLIDGMFSPRIDSIQSALDLASQRQKLLTNNLANINVPGYKRQDIDFNITLAQSMQQPQHPSWSGLSQDDAASSGNETGTDSSGTLRSNVAMNPIDMHQLISNNSSIRQDGNNVDLEQEVMGIAQTQMRYQALTSMATKYFSDLKTAMS